MTGQESLLAAPRDRRFKVFFRWYDLWIGAFYDRKQKALYVCPLPMIGVRIGRSERDWQLSEDFAALPESEQVDALW